MASMFLTCAVGSAAADIKARMHRPALDKTDVPGRISLMPGGVSRNIAENLARLGARSVFVGVFGDDAQAHSVIEASQAAGVHVGPILRPGYPTASMAVTLDVAGRQVAGVFSGEILDTLTPGDLLPHRDVIGQADAIVSDGGAPEDILIYLAESARQEAVFYCNPASVAFSARLTPVLARCDLLTCNHLEAYALTGSSAESEAEALRAASTLVERGVKRAVITLVHRGLNHPMIKR
jgi:pseudouridine kinase